MQTISFYFRNQISAVQGDAFDDLVADNCPMFPPEKWTVPFYSDEHLSIEPRVTALFRRSGRSLHFSNFGRSDPLRWHDSCDRNNAPSTFDALLWQFASLPMGAAVYTHQFSSFHSRPRRMFGLVVLTIFSGTELTLAKYIQLAQDEDF